MAKELGRLPGGAGEKQLIDTLWPLRRMTRRLVSGEDLAVVVGIVHGLERSGRSVTVQHLGPAAAEPASAEQMTDHHLEMLELLAREDLAAGTELSIELDSLGLISEGVESVVARVRRIGERGAELGVPISIAGRDRRIDAMLAVVAAVRSEGVDVGVAVQSSLRRSEDDCETLATAGTRVRLYSGGPGETEAGSYLNRADAELSFVRCLKIIMASDAFPVVAPHTARLLAVAQDVARRAGRGIDDYEVSMPRGVRTNVQAKLVELGYRVRVFVPYGSGAPHYLRALIGQPGMAPALLRGLVDRD